MELSSFNDYKSVLRARLESQRQQRSGLTLKKLASKIPIQYTYLSKVLNDGDSHLSEDHLFRASQLLGFYPDEIDYLLLLRAYQTAALPARREHAFKRLSAARKELRVNAEVQSGRESRLTHEMAYMLDPFAVVVYVALHVPAVRNDPRVLAGVLGVPQKRIGEILKTLSLVDLITMGSGPMTVLSVKDNKIHYSKEHPLMRVHQHLFKTSNLSQLLKLPEDEKESFQVTFSADHAAFEAIRKEFRRFLGAVEEISQRSKRNERVLQLNFDLFHWY